jgi:superfamily II DNA or RNA helicase
VKTQTLFSGKWVQTKPLVVSEPTRPELRRSQARAFAALKDKQRIVLQAPTGWGKSLVIASLILHKLLRNPDLRCVIAVPQTLIARGFVRDWQLRIAGRLVDWVVQHNLCHRQATGTVANLIHFVRGGHTSLGDRVLVCTHATLAHAYKRLKKRRQLALLKDLVLWIDEGHHAKNAEITASSDTVSNGIGALVKHCVRRGNHVGLATATFHRGDMRHIIPDKMLADFTQVRIPYDLYFEEVQPVESFEFNIIAGDTLKALDSIFGKPRPTILYLAKRNSRYAGRCKYLEVGAVSLVRRLCGSFQGLLGMAYVGLW